MSFMENNDNEVPSDQQMSAWYEVIHRVITICNDRSRPTNKVYTSEPLSAEIFDCVDRNFLVATRINANNPENRFQLNLTPKGQAVYDMLRADLIATGQIFPHLEEIPTEERVNPFDGMKK